MRDAKGRELGVLIDEETTGDKEISLGEYIETTTDSPRPCDQDDEAVAIRETRDERVV
jgi:hypothetical protein